MSNCVYVVTSYGKVIGVFEAAKDAFDEQMLRVNKGQLCELIPCVVKPSTIKTNGK